MALAPATGKTATASGNHSRPLAAAPRDVVPPPSIKALFPTHSGPPHPGVDALLDVRLGLPQELPREDDDGGGAVADLWGGGARVEGGRG
jgi:hypothetical protein